MRRIRMGFALVAVLATSALGAGTASAKPVKLDMTWGSSPPFEEHQVKAGDEFDLYSNEVTVATSIGNVTCSGEPIDAKGRYTQGIAGIDQTNDEKANKIELKSAFGSLYGGKACPNNTGLGEALVYVFGYSPMGILSLGANGKAAFNVKSASEPANVVLSFNYVACDYTFTKLKGTVKAISPSYPRQETTFTKQKLKLEKFNSAKVCPKTANLSALFNYSLTNEVYYIFQHIH